MVAGKPQNGECTHAQLSRFQVGSRWNVTHVPSHTRPSCYSACNIEKLGVAWEQGYTKLVFLRNGLMYEQETQTSDGLVNALSTELWMKLNSWVRGLHFDFYPVHMRKGLKWSVLSVCLSAKKFMVLAPLVTSILNITSQEVWKGSFINLHVCVPNN